MSHVCLLRAAAFIRQPVRSSTQLLLIEGSRNYGQRRESKPWKQKPNRKAKLALILKEDLPNLGSRGHVVRVEHGYGRNWLLPQGKAVYATPGNMKLFKATDPEAREENNMDIVSFMKKTFSEHEMCIYRGERGEWAIYEHHIVQELRKFRLHVPLDLIELAEPITSYGDHPVIIRVDSETAVPITVRVVRKPIQKPDQEQAQELQEDTTTENLSSCVVTQ